jgi:hypothetical protein
MKKVYLLLAGFLAAFALQGADIQVNDADLSLANGGTFTWTKDNTYILQERVFVDSGCVLNIEAGTIIEGAPGQGTDATALIVARGAQIFARGTAAEPIVFTAEGDNPANPFDIGPNIKGRWGGLIILGNASLNSSPGFSSIEGLPTGDSRSLYGAFADGETDDMDNSGVITYVSIRHGGTSIAPNNDINGLTLGGVGAGTEIHHVEVLFNFDDGVEFFGGTVNTKYMLVAFCGDDSYDYDEGYRGKNQFWVTIQSDSIGDRCGEFDGGTDPELGTPFATPTVYNATFIGRGAGAGRRIMTIRDNAGGSFCNSIFLDQDRGVDIEILGNGDDSYKHFQDGNLTLESNIFWNVAGNTQADLFRITADKYRCNDAANPAQCRADSTAEVSAAVTAFANYFGTAGNENVDPMIKELSSNSRVDRQEALDPRPTAGGPAYTGSLCAYTDPFFTEVNYKGAFAADGDFWLAEWSFLNDLGYFTPDVVSSNEPAFNSLFSVSPNPASNIIAVSAKGVSGASAMLNILDLNGRTVLSQEAVIAGDKLDATLDIQSLSNGVYFLQAIVNGETVASKKVMKQ